MSPETVAKKSKPRQVEGYALRKLHLDTNNPRFGAAAGSLDNEIAVLDFIVESFGIEDVLSSIAVNGYFRSEPLIGLREGNDDGIRIVEGNRRLAACLIIAGDPRARHQARRQQTYLKVHQQHGSKPIDPLPVLVFEGQAETEELLPYLGVRHIAGAQQWDSYAKAAWVAQVVERGAIDLADIVQMIGDEDRTSKRMLEGFYVVNQLIDTAHFNPKESQRRGRGSNPEYPFSWVYTCLNYKPVRKWLGLSEVNGKPRKNPLLKPKLENGGQLLTLMFGSKERPPAIQDSRQIGRLARAIDDPELRRMLLKGRSIEEVIEKSRPAEELLTEGLADVRETLGNIVQLLAQGSITTEQANKALDLSRKVGALAVKVNREISRLAEAEAADE